MSIYYSSNLVLDHTSSRGHQSYLFLKSRAQQQENQEEQIKLTDYSIEKITINPSLPARSISVFFQGTAEENKNVSSGLGRWSFYINKWLNAQHGVSSGDDTTF